MSHTKQLCHERLPKIGFDLISDGQRSRHRYFICVPRKLVIHITEIWSDVNMSKSKASNSDFHGLQCSRCAINENLILYSCNEYMLWNPMINLLNPDSYFFSSFTLLYFFSQVVTQMHRAVSYTYYFMQLLILCMIISFVFNHYWYPSFP